jgi:hypothetical protein
MMTPRLLTNLLTILAGMTTKRRVTLPAVTTPAQAGSRCLPTGLVTALVRGRIVEVAGRGRGGSDGSLPWPKANQSASGDFSTKGATGFDREALARALESAGFREARLQAMDPEGRP